MVAKSDMQAMLASSYLSGSSAAYIEELYEAYLDNPNNVSADWRDCFEHLKQAMPSSNGSEIPHSAVRQHFLELAKHRYVLSQATISEAEDKLPRKRFRVIHLINAFRSHGHHQANLDPLNLAERKAVSDLTLEYHKLGDADLNTVFDANTFVGVEGCNLAELYNILKQTYAGTIGVEYTHITDTEETQWIQERLERVRGKPQFSSDIKKRILERLTAAEGLEKYIGTKFTGQKRFSLEGGESLIPVLDNLIQHSGEQGVKEIVIGMAHRGRLNVLVNVMGKSPSDLFAEFEGTHIDKEHSGDVKYHLGYASDSMTPGGDVHLTLAFNPSHLEIIDPVVQGSVRARQERRDDQEHKEVLSVLIHGDAAFAGQGVIMETFSLSQARGFRTGGSVHIVINNQIGFTMSNPLDARSTLYCTDVAKMVQAPIFHVNGDDPEAVVFVTQLAVDFRNTFKKDVVVDLVCYRRHGHNEADEPAATQPIMYQTIRQHPTARKLYADKLVQDGILSKEEAEKMIDDYRDALDAGKGVAHTLDQCSHHHIANWKSFLNQPWDIEVDTTIKMQELKMLCQQLHQLPDGFTCQPQVGKIMADREKMASGEIPINWGFAETLAYATLVHQNTPVRLVGQDSRRGTFAHRHATLHDYKTGEEYTPLEHISKEQAPFTVIDSLLSEEAVMAFEYGFSSADPNSLVIWEAQFGDFFNGAQVVVDQFISSAEQKWGRLCGLVLFLPHGYEGQGPEHSSARLERFLQLCAQGNIQVCIPSTPAQAFHMIRRQMIRPYRKPLIVMTPKSLLRHKLAVSSLDDLTKGKFHLVIPEVDELDPKKVDRVILCSGKVYYDLLEQRRRDKQTNIAILRIEQLYPFPVKLLTEMLLIYKDVKEVIWCQEEPMNQGAWYCAQHWFRQSLSEKQKLYYAGRPSSAAPAVGSPILHKEQQQALVDEALKGKFK